MNTDKPKKSLRDYLTVSNISIRKRLPLLTCIILLIVITLFTAISYYGVRKTSLELGNERVRSLSDQFGSLFQQSTQAFLTASHKTANDEVVKQFLLKGNKTASSLALNKIKEKSIPGDTLTFAVDLLDKNKNIILTTSKEFPSRIPLESKFIFSASNSIRGAVGKFYLKNDSIFFPAVVSIDDNNKTIGYLVKWRLLLLTPQAIAQLTKLLGTGSSLFLGNDDGTIWNNLNRQIPSPPINIRNLKNTVEYFRANTPVIASAAHIGGAPWLVLIEISKNEVLGPSGKFLSYIILIGAILMAASILLVWLLSRHITEPLNKLTMAASDISSGNYSTEVEIEQKDELGKLANAFNSMIVQVRNSQSDLENKVHKRTVQLKNANAELGELNDKLKELDQLKTNFFTNVSHELRTPLALILGPSEKLLSQDDISIKNKKDLNVIQQNARILLRQVNNLLDLSKLEVGMMNPDYVEFNFSNLIRVISSYFESLASEQKVRFEINAGGNIIVQADKEKIERVIINLLSNAFKFTPKEGIIFCSLIENDGQAIFQVKDSGTGIKPAIKEAIFERFQQAGKGLNRHLGSSGLGLSIVKEFIELHHGKIWAENSKEGGAVFTFSIPVKAPEKTILDVDIDEDDIIEKNKMNAVEVLKSELQENSIPAKQILPDKITHSKNNEAPSILVVEDNIEMNKFITDILQDNYNVISAFNGRDGLTFAETYLPDLIITDVMMPEMTGDKLVDEIKKHPELENIPIILLTAKADELFKIRLLNKGINDYLNKPFMIEELRARVRNAINMKIVKDCLQDELKTQSDDIATLVQDVTSRKHMLESSLKEKEILLKEIHHRVKNNLQIISSLLNMQAGFIKDSDSIEAFRDSQNRIRAMALIHEKLYQSDSLLKINFGEYVKELIANLINSYNIPSVNVATHVEVEDISVNLDIAISLSLIITELVSNSLKHAFNNIQNQNCEVVVAIVKNESKYYCLKVKDNGVGLPGDFDFTGAQTLGLQLVNTITEQIDGEITLNTSGGTEFNIAFPLQDRNN